MLAAYGPLLPLFIARLLLPGRLRPSRLEVIFTILYAADAFATLSGTRGSATDCRTTCG